MYMHICAPFSSLRFLRLGSVGGTVRQVFLHSVANLSRLYGFEKLSRPNAPTHSDHCLVIQSRDCRLVCSPKLRCAVPVGTVGDSYSELKVDRLSTDYCAYCNIL